MLSSYRSKEDNSTSKIRGLDTLELEEESTKNEIEVFEIRKELADIKEKLKTITNASQLEELEERMKKVDQRSLQLIQNRKNIEESYEQLEYDREQSAFSYMERLVGPMRKMQALSEEKKEEFIHAIANNHKEVVENLLLDPLIKPYLRDKNLFLQTQCSALAYAVSKGHLDIVGCLIDKKAAVNCCNIDGDTALHLAVSNGNMNMVTCLLNACASNKMTNKHGDTPLHIAARKGHNEIIKMLVNNGSDITIKNNDGQIPRDLAKMHPKLSQDKQIMSCLKPPFSLVSILAAF